MKKRARRILSVILTVVMIFALLPVIGNPMVVKAEDTPAEHVAHDEQCSAEETDCEYHKGWTKISTWTELKSLGENGGNGYLVNDIKISGIFIINPDKTVNLCLNGCSVIQTADNTDTITVYGTLNLYDKKDNSGEIAHANGKNGSGVYNVGNFTMNGGKITRNNADHGGGVGNYGTFTMTEGTIFGNTATKEGGGVYNYGTFTMNRGTISGNNAIKEGGGVYNYKTFTMRGGTITGNKATIYGGGVDNYRTFTMNGGTIEKNNGTDGGGVNNFGTFTMTEGTISGNNAILGGGVGNNGTFTMTEGTIKDNITSKKGSGVYSYNSFVKEGGEIDGSIESYVGALCTVTFNANDGSDKTIIQYVLPNENTNLAPNKFTYDHNRFNGWNTDPKGKGTPYADKATINIGSDLTLNAQWIEEDKEGCDVIFIVNNGSWDDGTKEKTVRLWRYEGEDKALIFSDSDIPSLGKPDTGYKAGSWDTDPYTFNKNYVCGIDKKYTFTYSFKPIEYTVKFDANGGVGAMDNQSRAYGDGVALETNTFTFEGKTFNGWNTAADGSGTPYADGEANNLSSTDGDTVTLYAQWTIDTFTITWKDYDGTVLETDANVAYGTTPTFDGETPKRDNAGNIKYTFNGWTPEIDTVKGATTYTATYSEEEIVEPTEPEVPVITEPEPDPEIPEKDWLDDLRLALGIADELGGPQTVEYSGDFALPYEIMQYLVEHTDITFIYTVTYEGVEYTITIPGGKAIADPNIGWYGPLWLLANYGGENVPAIIAGSGRYTVVAGDTLSGIAEKFNTTVEELAKKNGIKNPDYIIVGQVIVY